MLKKLVSLLLAVFVIGSCLTNAQEPVKLAYVDFPPYEYQENGEGKGILVEIVQAIFQEIDVPLQLELFPFARALESTKTGAINGLFNFYKTDERLQHFDYSTLLIKNPLVFFVKKGSTMKFNGLADLQGKHIGIMRGYTYGTEFDNSSLFTKDEGDSHEANFKKLAAGRIDAYPCDKFVGIHIAQKEGLMAEFDILPQPLKVMNGYIGFTKGQNTAVIEAVDQAIQKLNDSGKIQSIIDHYISD